MEISSPISPKYGNETSCLSAFMSSAQNAVDEIQLGSQYRMDNVLVSDSFGYNISTFVSPGGMVYVRAVECDGQLVPVDIDEARQLVSKGPIVLNTRMVLRNLCISFGENQPDTSSHDKNHFEPFLVIGYIDLGSGGEGERLGGRIVTGAHCFYGRHRHDRIPIDNLVRTAFVNPHMSEVTTSSGPFDGKENLPKTAAEYMEISISLLYKAYRAISLNNEAGKAFRPVLGNSIYVNDLQNILDVYRDNLRARVKANTLGEQLRETRNRPDSENFRQILIEKLIAAARCNTEGFYNEIAPYNFDEVISSVDQAALLEVLEQIPDPYFRVVQNKEDLMLRIMSGVSIPDTLGMTYQEVIQYAAQNGLTLSQKEDVHFDHSNQRDAWIHGGLASGARAIDRLYSHPEIGACFSREIPMDVRRLGIIGRLQVRSRALWKTVLS